MARENLYKEEDMSLEKYLSKDVIATRPGKVIYREDDTVVKIFDKSYSKSDILNEALNQASAEESGLPIPKLLEVLNYDGLWGLRTEFIEGSTLSEMMEKHPENQDEYLDRFLKIQINMFNHKAPNRLNDLKAKFHNRISRSGFDATNRFELHNRLEGLPTHNKICHGDFVPSNIILHPDGTDYIIDWAHVTSGNASADVALTYLLFQLDDKVELAEEYLKRYCKMTDTAIQYVQKWMPIVAAVQSERNIEGQQEFLRRWGNIMEFE